MFGSQPPGHGPFTSPDPTFGYQAPGTADEYLRQVMLYNMQLYGRLGQPLPHVPSDPNLLSGAGAYPQLPGLPPPVLPTNTLGQAQGPNASSSTVPMLPQPPGAQDMAGLLGQTHLTNMGMVMHMAATASMNANQHHLAAQHLMKTVHAMSQFVANPMAMGAGNALPTGAPPPGFASPQHAASLPSLAPLWPPFDFTTGKASTAAPGPMQPLLGMGAFGMPGPPMAQPAGTDLVDLSTTFHPLQAPLQPLPSSDGPSSAGRSSGKRRQRAARGEAGSAGVSECMELAVAADPDAASKVGEGQSQGLEAAKSEPRSGGDRTESLEQETEVEETDADAGTDPAAGVPVGIQSGLLSLQPSELPGLSFGPHSSAAPPQRKVGRPRGSMGPGLGEVVDREAKKQKRKQSNRESARRSRLRKQAEMHDVEESVDNLSKANDNLINQVAAVNRTTEQLDQANSILRELLVITKTCHKATGMPPSPSKLRPYLDRLQQYAEACVELPTETASDGMQNMGREYARSRYRDALRQGSLGGSDDDADTGGDDDSGEEEEGQDGRMGSSPGWASPASGARTAPAAATMSHCLSPRATNGGQVRLVAGSATGGVGQLGVSVQERVAGAALATVDFSGRVPQGPGVAASLPAVAGRLGAADYVGRRKAAAVAAVIAQELASTEDSSKPADNNQPPSDTGCDLSVPQPAALQNSDSEPRLLSRGPSLPSASLNPNDLNHNRLTEEDDLNLISDGNDLDMGGARKGVQPGSPVTDHLLAPQRLPGTVLGISGHFSIRVAGTDSGISLRDPHSEDSDLLGPAKYLTASSLHGAGSGSSLQDPDGGTALTAGSGGIPDTRLGATLAGGSFQDLGGLGVRPVSSGVFDGLLGMPGDMTGMLGRSSSADTQGGGSAAAPAPMQLPWGVPSKGVYLGPSMTSGPQTAWLNAAMGGQLPGQVGGSPQE